ncbi:MAG: TRAP transporter small permease subunit [Dehalococcoidales bacterium]|nr:TRAP transporter small permease subunit [Dehalococcoidales bacterium]
MPRVLANYVRYIDTMNRKVGVGVGYVVLVIISILLVEAIRRYGFNMPTVWSIEVSQFLFGAYFIVGGGYALLSGGMVRMDILYSRWSPRKRAIIDAAMFALMAIYLVTTVIACTEHAMLSTQMLQHSGSPWRPPLYPIKITVAIGVFLLLLQGISCFIRDMATIRGKPLP